MQQSIDNIDIDDNVNSALKQGTKTNPKLKYKI